MPGVVAGETESIVPLLARSLAIKYPGFCLGAIVLSSKETSLEYLGRDAGL